MFQSKSLERFTVTRGIYRVITVALLMALGLTVFCWGNLALIASAHAHLKSATVGPNAIVNQAPSSITLVFGEESDLKQTTVQVMDGSGTDATSGPASAKAGDATTWTVNLKPNLSNGTYTVKYHTLTDDDGGIVDGSYTFKVDSSAAASSASNATGSNEQESGGNAANVPATGEGGASITSSSATSLSLITSLALVITVASAVLVLRRKTR